MKKYINNLNKVLQQLGFNPAELPLMSKIVYVLHLLSGLIKDGHCISLGSPGVGKTTPVANHTNSICATQITSPAYFGNANNKIDGYICDKNDVAYTEQASAFKKMDDNLINTILTHCNGDEVERIGKENTRRTSIVLLGNCDLEYGLYDENDNPTSPKPIDSNFYNVLPDALKEKQNLERFISLPSFLLEKVTTEMICIIENESLKELIRENRQDATEYLLGTMNVRHYKATCKIMTALNFFINDQKQLQEESYLFKGFKAIAESLIEISSRKQYQNFYYKNEDGRKLALALILDNFSDDDIIEEAHFFENRAMIKLEGSGYWLKIALTYQGKLENIAEYELYKQERPSFISEIIEISKNKLVLKQKYIPLCSDFFSVKDFGILYGSVSEVDKIKEKVYQLNETIKNQSSEIETLKKTMNTLIFSISDLLKGNTAIVPQILNFKDDLEESNKKIYLENLHQKIINFFKIKKIYIKNRNLGVNNREALLVNFSSLIKM